MNKFRLLAVIFLLIAVCVPVNVRADVAPPGQPPGSNPGPDFEETNVRMMAETVLIDVQANTPANSLGVAKITADFTMRNLGSDAESMAVRFPLSTNNGFDSYPEIKDMQIKVDGKSLPTRREMQEDPSWGSDLVPWAVFDVTFPPNQDVQIQVTYSLQGTGEYPYVAFYYIFHTGEGWRDTIGSADLIVRLPYEANSSNVIFDEQTGWSMTTPGGEINGNEVRWHFENLEPSFENDFELSLVIPSVWKKVLSERENVAKDPNDGEAWGRLGKLYKEIFFFRRGFRHDAGGQQLYQLSIDAYSNAVSLLPDDALWHAGFADLLAIHAYYASQEGENASDEMLRSMQEIDRALELSPNDARVKEIAEKVYNFFPGAVDLLESGYDFLWLTATPVMATQTDSPASSTPTVETTPTAFSTETAIPTKEAVPVPATPVPTATNPICGSLGLAPLGLLLLMSRKKYS